MELGQDDSLGLGPNTLPSSILTSTHSIPGTPTEKASELFIIWRQRKVRVLRTNSGSRGKGKATEDSDMEHFSPVHYSSDSQSVVLR